VKHDKIVVNYGSIAPKGHSLDAKNHFSVPECDSLAVQGDRIVGQPDRIAAFWDRIVRKWVRKELLWDGGEDFGARDGGTWDGKSRGCQLFNL